MEETQKLRIAHAAAAFFRWWNGEIAGCVPQFVRRFWSADPIVLRIHVDGQHARVLESRHAIIDRSSEPRPVARGTLEELKAARFGSSGGWSFLHRRELVIPLSRCLYLQKSLPFGAARRGHEILGLELVRTTPFSQQDIYFDWWPAGRQSADGSVMAVNIVVCKRSFLDPLLDEVRHTGLKLHAVRVEDGNQQLLPANLLARAGSSRRSPAETVRWFVGGLAAVLVGLAVLSVGAHIWRQEQTLELIHDEVRRLKNDALALSKAEEKVDTLHSRTADLERRKDSARTLVAVWEDVSRILPDNAWLTSLRLESGKVFLDGHSSSAAELIGLLSAWASAGNVEFISPVTFDEQSGLERFQIRIGLRDAAEPNETNRAGRGSEVVP